ncbi:N-alpha-acetyltransferase [Acrasis kona]|uniref:N-alpha-acetyltransferase n=1 Tax=Acrasis kona TaxID=1008807 RepID=A0AAW2ZQ51_9EUKA
MTKDKKDSGKINTSNLLSHNDKPEAPCKTGFAFRYQGIIEKNIQQLKILNKHIYAASDKEKFYTEVINKGPNFSYFAVFNDISVGAVCTKQIGGKIHISLIHVLPAYRKLGVGTRLIEKAAEIAESNKIKVLTINVPVSDNDIANFITKMGFEKEEVTTKDQHEDADSYVYTKSLVPSQ